MDLKFINQNKNPVVDDPHDNGEDIPERFVSRSRVLKKSFRFFKGSLRPVPVSVITAFTALMVEKCGPIARHSFTSVTKQTVAHAGPSPRQLRYPIAYAFIPKEKYRCSGGWPIEAWKYFIYAGLVTGGNYKSKGCCRPYEIHPCGHHGNEPYYGECPDNAPTPPCRKRCQAGYRKSFPRDKYFGTWPIA
ncbi:hypothetical protein COOONC_03005 [Cooperia oncophora]